MVELTDHERIAFERIRKYMIEQKAWKAPYSEQLAHYCRFMTIAAEASKAINQKGIIQKFRNGVEQLSPALSAYIKACGQQFDMAVHFGFTPKSKSNLIGSGNQLPMFPDDLPNPMASVR